MKKKNLILIICAIIVVAALAASLIFVLSGNTDNPGSNENGKPISLTGTWLVAANYTNDAPVFTDGQFMIFTDSQASMYKDASGDAYAESSYTVNEANQLILSDISREYKVDQKTANCVRLYDTTNTYMLLVKNSKEEREIDTPSVDFLNGKWNVTLKGDVRNNGEVMEFEGHSLNYYKDASAEPFKTADYTLDGSVLTVSALGLTMRCYKIAADTMIFIEESGIVWELSK